MAEYKNVKHLEHTGTQQPYDKKKSGCLLGLLDGGDIIGDLLRILCIGRLAA